jgi:hypothetical protein
MAVMSALTLPTTGLSEVYHVGTLNPSDKGMHGTSFEGHGLSVSLDPERWVEIAQLGGLPWHKLSRKHACFLDFHQTSEQLREEIAFWGIEHGLVTQEEHWTLTYFDDELDSEMVISFPSCEEAVAEALDMEIADEDSIASVHHLISTSKMDEATNQPRNTDALHVLTAMWVEARYPELDGVWWQDDEGPMSAPRGVIMPSRIFGWSIATFEEVA